MTKQKWEVIEKEINSRIRLFKIFRGFSIFMLIFCFLQSIIFGMNIISVVILVVANLFIINQYNKAIRMELVFQYQIALKKSGLKRPTNKWGVVR